MYFNCSFADILFTWIYFFILFLSLSAFNVNILVQCNIHVLLVIFQFFFVLLKGLGLKIKLFSKDLSFFETKCLPNTFFFANIISIHLYQISTLHLFSFPLQLFLRVYGQKTSTLAITLTWGTDRGTTNSYVVQNKQCQDKIP